ncbi:MAG: extracellular solute-binding protein [Planctomycetota bacterium]|nr:extracellular solute-binding protein [Planctomycetota bacterium]
MVGAMLLCMVCLAGAARGGAIEDREGKTVIHVSVFALPDPTSPLPASRADLAVVNEFKRRFAGTFAQRYRDKYKADPQRYGRHNWDHVEVELHRATGILVEGVEGDLMGIAGGMAPDLLYVQFRKSDNYIRNGFLYPLDKPEDGYFASLSPEEKDLRIHPNVWPVIDRKGPDGRKHVWTMPFGGLLGMTTLYRKDLFDRAGVPYPTNNWTWDDLLNACRKITDPANGVYGVALDVGSSWEAWFWYTYLWSAGGDVMVYDEKTDKWRCTFDSREAAVALEFYTRLTSEAWTDRKGIRRRGYVYPAGTTNKWENGEVGMAVGYINESVFNTINPDVTGIVPVPLGPTGVRGGELNSTMMGLFAGIAEPAVRDAAWEYMRFFDAKDAMRIRVKIMVEGGMGRFLNPKYLRMFGYDELIRLAPPGWEECINIAMATGKPEPYGQNSNFVCGILTGAIQKARLLSLSDRLPTDPAKRLDVMQGLLHASRKEADTVMLDEVTPGQRTVRRVTAAVALAGAAAAFLAVFLKIARLFSPPPAMPGERKPRWRFRRKAVVALLLAPAILSVLVWQYVPLVRGSVMAFQNYNVMGDSAWVGLDNFGNVLWDADWWASLWNSLRYSFLIIALTFLPPVALAILLQEVPRGKVLFRTIYYLPAVTSGLAIVVLWKQFYEGSEFGALNAMLMHVPAVAYIAGGLVLLGLALAFARRVAMHGNWAAAAGFALTGGLLMYTCCSLSGPIFSQPGVPFWAAMFQALPEAYNWLLNPDTAMLCCVVPMVWAGMGPGCLIYLAALKSVPDEAYEAADIAGATFIDKILFIVFPMLKPLLIINFVGVFIGSWNASSNILVMTGGGANTKVADLNVFYTAFMYLKMGQATAMAWILGAMLIGFTVYQLRILSRLEFKSASSSE